MRALRGDGGGANQSPSTAQGLPLKNARERMDVIAAYREVGTYRGAAEICGTTHKTVQADHRGARGRRRGAGREGRRGRNYDEVAELVAQRVDDDRGPDLGEAAAAGGAGGRVCRVGPQLPAAGRRGEAGVAARQHAPGPAAGGVDAG